MATAAAPFRHTVKLDQVDPSLAFANVHVEGPLDAKTAQTLASDVGTRIEALSGRPFGLLMDLRQGTSCDDAARALVFTDPMKGSTPIYDQALTFVKTR